MLESRTEMSVFVEMRGQPLSSCVKILSAIWHALGTTMSSVVGIGG